MATRKRGHPRTKKTTKKKTTKKRVTKKTTKKRATKKRGVKKSTCLSLLEEQLVNLNYTVRYLGGNYWSGRPDLTRYKK